MPTKHRPATVGFKHITKTEMVAIKDDVKRGADRIFARARQPKLRWNGMISTKGSK